MLSFAMLSVIKLSVVMLNVVAPSNCLVASAFYFHPSLPGKAFQGPLGLMT
jgi:hypothetical protein